jgi:hypothetical protein
MAPDEMESRFAAARAIAHSSILARTPVLIRKLIAATGIGGKTQGR